MTKNFLLLVAIVIALWIGFFASVVLYPGFSGWEQRGQFGDTFGAINSLFSGLALAGLVYTVFLQQKQLKLQQEELRITNQELARNADAQESFASSSAGGQILLAHVLALAALSDSDKQTEKSTVLKARLLEVLEKIEKHSVAKKPNKENSADARTSRD